ncbi:hypothetical protein SteCoe_18589 [Stentor coeruleus]|uniref:Uncharacterized protein n=1 Tax=Stentor coeruleus TaxID=5963 RepID=A0A1R2BWK4_9CILI|nr:hypothetical protein SteCoe_18589 [Stentor coeruleus]
MISDKSQLNNSITIKEHLRKQRPMLGSPYSRSLKKIPDIKFKKIQEMTPSKSENHLEKPENIILNRRPRKKTIKLVDMPEVYSNVEKAKHFSLKLARMIANKSITLTAFQIYTEIYNEIADFLPEFKDLLLILRKGLIISALREKDFEEFEFNKELEKFDSDLYSKYNKERKEKKILVKKLDVISSEYIKIKDKFEEMEKKVIKYEKIIFPNADEIERNGKKILDMRSQFSILQKQKSCILELKKYDPKVKKVLEQIEIEGMKFGQIMDLNEQDLFEDS